MEIFHWPPFGQTRVWRYTLVCRSSVFAVSAHKKRLISDEGFTLTELLVATSLSAILFLILGGFLTTFYQSREVPKVMLELQEQARFAMELIMNGEIKNNLEIRQGGLSWASSYTFDSENNFRPASSFDQPDPDLPGARKKIFFPDYAADPGTWIGYVQHQKKLLRVSRSAGGSSSEQTIIPYIDAGKTEVEVNFWPGAHNAQFPSEIDPSQTDPNRAVSIQVTVSKDGLKFTLDSLVSLRNY